MGGHSQFLVKELGLTRDEVERARAGETVEALTEQQQVLIRFVRRLAERPRQIDADDIAALRAQSLDDAAIVEAMSVCMMAAVTNTFADALKFDEDLERLGMRSGYF
jgi:alkylhydroperoxidase family enzyme